MREPLLTPDALRVVACPRPFSVERVDLVLPHGGTLAELLEAAGVKPSAYAHVFVDDRRIAREWWPRARPRPGSTITVRVVPSGGRGGGGGGGGGKDATRIVLTIAVAALAAVAGFVVAGPILGLAAGSLAFSITAGLVSVGVGVVGTLLVNAIAPPPVPKLSGLSGIRGTGGSALRDSPTLSITGTQNRAAPYGPIPRVFGKHRIFPPLGAAPYTEIVGNDQYLRMLFVPGYGPLQLTDLKIGDTPLANFTGVESEIRQGYPGDAALTLYTDDVAEDALSILLSAAASWQVRTTQANADELSVDIMFPTGLVEFDDQGAQKTQTVQVDVEYRLVGAGGWTVAPGGPLVVTDNRTSQVRRGLRWTVAKGTYEVRLQRVTADTTDVKIHDQVFWSALRTIRKTDPVKLAGLAKIALRIKATDQLSGIVDRLNCLAESILPDWNGSSWVSQVTSNPASIYREVLQGAANARPVADSRLDLTELQAWHTACAAAGRKFNAVIDFQTTVFELLRDVAAVGRASFGMRDGNYSVVRDVAQTVPIQHFTQRNSWGFRGQKAFPDQLHAFKARFINPDADWQQDERIVYDDGQSEATATKFEVLELFGVTDRDQAWKDGRYHLATARLRPEVYELHTDVEFLVCTRGDLVRVVHDVPLWGLAVARVKAVQVDGGSNATGVTLDNVVPMAAGKSYACRFRKADGATVVQQVTTVAGDQSTVTFTAAIAAANKPAVGDLMLFGELGVESVELLVKAIEPGRDLTAKLILVDAAPAVHAADTGAIPPYTSQITLPPSIQRMPAVPIVDGVRSDETVLVRSQDGALESRISIALHFVSTTDLPAAFVDVRYRRRDSTSQWLTMPYQPADTGEVSVRPVEDRVTYDVHLRSIARLGEVSDWVTLQHTVVGKSTKPPDVTGLFLERTRDRAILRWVYVSPPRDFAGFRVRQHAGDHRTWEDAIPAHGGLLAEAQLIVNRTPGTTRSFLVKAVDVAGNESATAAVLVVEFILEETFGDPVIANLIETIDHKALGFPGTKTNGAVVAGDLKANDNGTLFWTASANPFWQADETKTFWTLQYLEMLYLATLTPEGSQIGTDLQLDLAVTAGSWKMEYRFATGRFWAADGGAKFWSTDAALFWATLPDYIDWPGQISNLTRQEYALRLTTGAGLIQGVCSKFDLKLDVPDLEEEFKDLVVAAPNGTRLPITKTYRAIKTVQATLLDDGGAARSVKTIDKDANVGPLMKTLDAAGVATAGKVDARLKGY